VKSTLFVLPALGIGLALSVAAQNPGKVGVINIQGAIVSTKDGQKAASEIQSRFAPKKAELEKRQVDIAQLQDQLNRGRNTLSQEAQRKLVRDIDQKTKSLNRDTDDAREELQQEEQKVMGELYGRIQVVIEKYAKDNGYTLVLDDSSQQTPVLFASGNIDITRDIIELYDKNAPGAPAASPAGARPPITRPVAPPKPAAPK